MLFHLTILCAFSARGFIADGAKRRIPVSLNEWPGDGKNPDWIPDTDSKNSIRYANETTIKNYKGNSIQL